MDAIKFVKERNRMCKSFGGSCDGCPADAYGDNVCPQKKDATPITCYDCRRKFWSKEV